MDKWDFIFFAVGLGHLIICPFTKVEESFNVQAMHDLIFIGPLDISRFDHLQFPGVVPRSFIGALIIYFLTSPVVGALKLVGISLGAFGTKIRALIACRSVILILQTISIGKFRRSFCKKFQGQSEVLPTTLGILNFCQFHLVFYSSRPLPNTFAMIAINFALAYWLSGQICKMVVILAFTSVVFRCDTVVLALPLVLHSLWTYRTSIKYIIAAGIISSLISILVTITVDSYFWGRWVWPELEVFYFNSVLNKSSEWGISPIHWYFTSALPRALMLLLPFFILAHFSKIDFSFKKLLRVKNLDLSVFSVSFPILAYLCLYSLLPHKELRFIFPSLPVLTSISAIGITKLHRLASLKLERPRAKFIMRRLLFVIPILNLTASLLFLYISSLNYPGGVAFQRLHSNYLATSLESHPVVHISNLAAITGVSRFGERQDCYFYDKTEGISEELHIHFQNSTGPVFLLAETDNIDGFELKESIYGYCGIRFKGWLPSISMCPKIHILRSVS